MKKIIQYLVILLILTISSSSFASKVNASFQLVSFQQKLIGPRSIDIIVIDELGKPVSGANVFIPESGLGSVNTDESGTATFMIDSEKGEMKALITTDGMTTTQMVSPDETNTVVISR